ncbi:protein NRT1/ PTR FAMILY 5.14 [Prunus yedoensis var. nudiflora]|uniref:Protein NRT1/ PTR FAMILY 5.14 n=1 Tax=Prunus yedoensis var. nudiflora TaxID=2094558 RepID=A0A314XLV4_PRUYE|nr:protein NRT1/ PTR FAMILY 5.14 [Prunus yedoensis var. nudiflora]
MGLGALIHFVREYIHKYLYFSKATICIQGLVLSHSFVNHAIMSILITYLQNNWYHPHFQIAAVVTNVQEGVADILVIFLAHFSHTFNGGLKIIATTNAAYILGLSLLWLPNEYKSEDYAALARIFYAAVVLLTLGESGRSAALKEFLNKQCLSKHKETGCTDDKRPEGWEEASEQKEITAEKHTEAGGDQQVTKETAERDTKDFWGVPWFLGAVVPLFLLKTTWTQIFMISTIAMAVSYLLFWFGFNDYLKNNKEAQGGEHPQVTERENLWTLNKKVRKKKRLRKEIVASCSFLKYIISFLFPKLIPKRTRMRIGCGMASTVLCCVAAWVVEIHRMRKVTRAGLEDDTSETISMSMFWLVPQFFLLGLMEGLAVDGLIDLLVDRVDEEDKEMAKNYGSHTSDLVVGIGKLLTALIILAFKQRWFNDSINLSRLDKYYRLLTFLSLGSFVYYLCVGFYFYSKDDTQNSAIEEHEQGHNGSGNMEMATV